MTENFDSVRVPVRAADRRPGPYPYYGASGVVDFVDSFLFDGEYLLVAEDGENLRTRKTPIAFIANGRFWVNNHAHVIRGSGCAETRFLHYYLSVADISGFLSGSTQPKLTQASLNRIPIRLPPINEQRAIAGVLGALDDKIELNRRMNETLDAVASAMYLRLRQSSRAASRLGDIVELAYGKALKEADRRPGTVPVFGSSGIVGSHDQALAAGPGIVVGRKGNPGVVTWSHDAFYPIDTTFYVMPRVAGTSLYYLYFALRNIDLPSFAADSAVPGLNRNIAYGLEIETPRADDLEDFDRAMSSLFAKKAANDAESQTLAELRDALLPKLISGELRVRDENV